MKHEYRELMDSIQVPQELNRRVLEAARQKPAPRRTACCRPVWRAAVCAVLALALVAGGISLRPMSKEADPEARECDEALELPRRLTCTFGLTVCAAEPGEAQPVSVNGALAFAIGDEMRWSDSGGYYTGCLMRITGEGIRQISLTLDRGEFYRCGETAETTRLGSSVAEDYDPETCYGFWVSGAAADQWAADLRAAARASVEELDGARLAVTVTFADGTERTDRYRLSTGFLVSAENENGEITMVPALKGAQSSRYGVYAVSEKNSVWFRWPVEGSHTVSLSNRYGFRAAPGGAGGTFHAGIDIPAEAGTSVLAAAGGTVTEAGFDPDRGNYLVLDHGDGMETVYAHCLSLAAEVGDSVEPGQVIAAVGSTGKSTGPHLCFQVWQAGEAQNPVAYFDAETREQLSMA